MRQAIKRQAASEIRGDEEDSGGKGGGKEIIPSRKPRGDTTMTMTMKACHNKNSNHLTMIGVVE
jgi:hypothetical protein